jgi:chromosome segregation ATPase
MTQISKFAGPPISGSADTRKDSFTLLEQRVEALAERHREALGRAEELRRQVADRDREIAELARRVTQLQRMRDEVAGRVDHAIQRLDRMSEWAASLPEEPRGDEYEGPQA